MKRRKKSTTTKRELLLDAFLAVPEFFFYLFRVVFGGIVRLFKYWN